MIRSSKHIIKYQTFKKSNYLNKIFDDFQSDVEFYINQICSNQLELKKNLSSSILPSNKILHIDKLNRSGEQFKCQCCEYENDADINAAINISRMGVYNPHNPENQFD